eukprot:2660376-Rhodomonas_salina.2
MKHTPQGAAALFAANPGIEPAHHHCVFPDVGACACAHAWPRYPPRQYGAIASEQRAFRESGGRAWDFSEATRVCERESCAKVTEGSLMGMRLLSPMACSPTYNPLP